MTNVIFILFYIMAAYSIMGLLFGVYFFFAGAKKMDPAIAESKWTVRLLLLPGAIGLWILLLPKVFTKKAIS